MKTDPMQIKDTVLPATEPAKGWSHGIRSVISNIGLLILSSVLILSLCEVYFRLFSRQPIVPRYVETSEFGIRRNIANVRGHMIVPEYQHAFSTDSNGFRGTKDHKVAKPQGIYRVIVLGDSVTLGHGVDDEETFSFLLEQKLLSIRPTEVINMGVSGFGTAEELIQFRTEGLKYIPDLVILSYFPNDPYGNAVSQLFKLVEGKLVQQHETFVPALYIRDRLYTIPGWSFLCQHSHLVNFARNKASAFFQNKLAAEVKMDSTIPEKLTQEDGEFTAALINAVATEAAAYGAKFVLLNIPVVVAGETIDNIPKDLVVSSPAQGYVDARLEAYSGYAIQDLYYPEDAHPKPIAHRLIASKLADYIEKHIWEVSKANAETRELDDRRDGLSGVLPIGQ